jgi:hypothetical protein
MNAAHALWLQHRSSSGIFQRRSQQETKTRRISISCMGKFSSASPNPPIRKSASVCPDGVAGLTHQNECESTASRSDE